MASIDDSRLAPSVTPIANAVALAGINTPLWGLAVTTPNDSDSVSVVVSAVTGVLTVDPGPGTTVNGDGSHIVWITGTMATVNARLATLVYHGAAVGSDRLTAVAISANGVSTPITMPVTIGSLEGGNTTAPRLTLISGTVILDSRVVDHLDLVVKQSAGPFASATIEVLNSTLGSGTSILLNDADGTAVLPRLVLAGTVISAGALSFAAGPALMTLALGTHFVNTGTVSFAGSTAQVRGGGIIENDGVLDIAGQVGGIPVTIGPAITGIGDIFLHDGASLALTGPVAAGQTIHFDMSGSSEFLRLDNLSGFTASVTGFASGDAIDLAGVSASVALYTQSGSGTGSLALYAANARIGTLRIAGPFTPAMFHVAATAGGTRITVDAPMLGSVMAASSSASVSVYRFTDPILGTDLFTTDPAERDAVLAIRPDLTFQGIGFEALAPDVTGPDVTPVYRFFDTLTGGHFFTASETERNAIVSSRPDLIFEPASTMLERTKPETGDIPVYRFFDPADGAHLFTADATMRASILADHPVIRDEGIAFYAASS